MSCPFSLSAGSCEIPVVIYFKENYANLCKAFLQLFFTPQARLRDPGLYRYHARGAKLPRVSSRV